MAVAAQQEARSEDRSLWIESALAAGCGLLLGGGAAIHQAGVPDEWVAVVYVVSLLMGSLVPLKETVPEILRGKIDVDFLMLLAAFGAAYLNQVGEGAMLMFLFSGAGALEHYTLRRTRDSIRALQGHLEDEAVRLNEGGGESVIPADEVQVGDRLLVRPGARVPADGEVVDGLSSVNQAALTGESLPVVKQAGDEVMAGAVNLPEGALVVLVTRPPGDSTLARMIRLVEDAQQNRAEAQVFTDWFGERYTKVVIGGSLLAWIIPAWGFGVPWGQALYRAMTLLVVASPCALVLATPAAILSAISGAARRGILVKGGATLEAVAKAKAVVFDKTGTLTYGKPHVERVIPLDGLPESEILRLAAIAEQRSEHPLAVAIVDAARARGLEVGEPDSFRSVIGKGVVAELEGRTVLVGSPRLFDEEGAPVPECPCADCPDRVEGVCKALRVGTKDGPLGLLDLDDTIREESAAAVAGLKRCGIVHVALLTGDLAEHARVIADAVGADQVHSQLLPDEKLRKLEEIRRQYGGVIMVGDGVNDAPALAAADVGVAMGGIGSDVALETADIVLTSDDLSRLPMLRDLAVRTTRTVRQNLIFAIAVMAVMIILTLAGGSLVRLPAAVIAHEGGTVLVILNGLRLLKG